MIKVLKMKRKDKPQEVPRVVHSRFVLVVEGSRHDVDLLVKDIFESLQRLSKKW